MNAFNRLSFTTRLMIVAFIAAVGPILVAYVAMLDLPQKVASGSVELALRETSSDVLGTIREDRLQLRETMAERVSDPKLRTAVLHHDDAGVRLYLSNMDPELRYEWIGAENVPAKVGPVDAPVRYRQGDKTTGVVVYKPLDDDAVDALAASSVAPIAVTYDGKVVARSREFPESISPGTMRHLDTLSQGDRLHSQLFTDNGTKRHLFVRPIGLDPHYRLAAVSTPRLEKSALAGPRKDVLETLAFLVVATALFAFAGAAGINRSIRGFSNQTRRLAEGNYDARLPVRGNDSFAGLAESYNQLAAELKVRIEQLEESADRYARTLETVEEGVVLWTGGRVDLWNAGAERLTGVTHGEVDTETDHPLIEFLRGQLTPGTRRVTLPNVRSGQRLIVDLNVTPVPGGSILQTFRDITSLEVLQQTRRNFMATAAHELRTPLTTILGFAQTLNNPDIVLSDSQRAHFLNLVEEQAEHLQRLTDAFFTNHQLANERVEVSIGEVPLREAVEEGIAKARTLPRGAQLPPAGPVEVDIDPKLVVRADRRALAGVVALLVDNAWKYGAPPLKIDAHVYGRRCHIGLHDAGPGIEAQHLDRLFDPFYRIDVDMRSGVGGAGLGLFTARKLVTAMKGLVAVESSPGEGTCFTIELPVAGRGRPAGGNGHPARVPASAPAGDPVLEPGP